MHLLRGRPISLGVSLSLSAFFPSHCVVTFLYFRKHIYKIDVRGIEKMKNEVTAYV